MAGAYISFEQLHVQNPIEESVYADYDASKVESD